MICNKFLAFIQPAAQQRRSNAPALASATQNMGHPPPNEQTSNAMDSSPVNVYAPRSLPMACFGVSLRWDSDWILHSDHSYQ